MAKRPTTTTSPAATTPTQLTTTTQGAPDRSSRALLAKLPAYERIVADVRARIDSGELAPGDAIPSETEMIANYGVSRITVRHAIASLRAAGLISTEHGRGSRVRQNLARTPGGTLDFDPAITRQGHVFITWDATGWSDVEEPSRYRTDAAHHAAALAIAASEPVFVLERQLIHHGGTQATHRSYVPFGTAADADLTSDPFQATAALYQALTSAGHELSWHDATRAEMPTPDDAVTLNVADGVPLLVFTRVTANSAGRILALEETRLPADRTQIVHHH